MNQYHKSDKTPYTIYADHEYLIEKIDDLKIILTIHLQQKLVKIFHLVFSVSTILSFKNLENKHDLYRGENCMKKFCEGMQEDN